jgi:general secretion pathway protein M
MNAASVLARPCYRALAALAGVVLLAGVGVAWPWSAQNRAYDELADRLAHQLQRFEGIKAREPELQNRLRELEQRGKASTLYLKADTAALAGAELQSLVKQVVGSNKGNVMSTQILPVEQRERERKITLRVRMTGDTEALLGVFHALEQARPLLFLDNVSIRSRALTRRKGQRKTEDRLDVTYDLSAYMREAKT